MDPRSKDLKQDCSSPTTTWLPWARARSRVVTIHLDTDGSLSPATEYHDASVLHTHLQEHKDSHTPSRRSIYILEALSPQFITLFQSHFQLHPAFFKDHERHVALYNRATGEAVGVPLLPSANYGRDYVSLKYHEPLLMNPLPTGFQNLCDVSGRHAQILTNVSNAKTHQIRRILVTGLRNRNKIENQRIKIYKIYLIGLRLNIYSVEIT